MFDHTTCWFQLALDVQSEPGKRTFTSPYRVVLEACSRVGIFDLTEEEVHNVWTIPRILGSAKILGVEMDVLPWQEDGMVTVTLKD